MSIIIQGDGSITSSIALNTLTLPNPTQNPRRIIDNIDLLEGDGGWEWTYEKGTYRRPFLYRFRLLTEAQKFVIEKRFLEVVRGRLHWFTLQIHGQAVTNSLLQEYSGGSNYIVENTILDQDSQYWRGYWIFVLTGAAAGQKRKIYNSFESTFRLYVSPAFDNTIAVGDSVILGYPVRLDDLPVFNPRKPNFWDMDLSFIERISS